MTNLYDKIFENKKYNLSDKIKIAWVEDWIKRDGFRTILDVGCGRGHYLKALKGYKITGLEPSKYLCEHGLQGLPDILHGGLPYATHRYWEALYCMDVLEHISPHQLDEVIISLSKLAPVALIGVANHSDIWEGVELHLVQEDAVWWKKRLEQHYKNVELVKANDRFYLFEVEV